MAGRRRKGNPLLTRIILISVAVHIIALPILAHFGAFKKISQGLGLTQVVVLSPPPEKARPEVKKEQRAVRKTTAKGKAAGGHKPSGPKSNLNQPKVVAARGPETGGSAEPTVDANGTGKAGQLPTPLVTKTTGSTPPKVDSTPAVTAPTPKPTPEPITKPVPEKPAQPAPEVKAPRVPVLTEVAATFNPSPTIPDDLRAEALHTTVSAQFIVSAAGVPEAVQIVRSSGNDELDRLALETAKKWRFKPATRDGQPIESKVILHIEFEVQ